jgi:hypothetical protein
MKNRKLDELAPPNGSDGLARPVNLFYTFSMYLATGVILSSVSGSMRILQERPDETSRLTK